MSRRGRLVAKWLDRLGIISDERLGPTVSLGWPRVVTGFSIMSKQTADLAMVGIAVGTAGTAGLAFAMAYWSIIATLGLGIAGGTISLVSQNFGSDHLDRAALVIKQSILLAFAFSIPIMAFFFAYPEQLIGIFGGGEAATEHGVIYLLLVTPAVILEILNLIASRTYTGVGDTFTEMIARAGGAVVNILLSGIFIFGFEMGVAGAALGTTFSTGLVTMVLGWGMFGRSYGMLGMEPSPVPISVGGRWIHLEILRQLIEISIPEITRRVAGSAVVFPLLWVSAGFGDVVVTAFEVARRVRGIMNSVNWGLSLASSSLVGQQLGAGDETEAGAYGADIIRLGMVIFVGLAIIVVAFASPIARLFVSESEALAITIPFVAIGAISAIGFGLNGAATGALVGAGYTRWPLVAALIGRWCLALPVALIGLFTPLGVVGLYLALLLETFVPGGINWWLFRAGRWKAASRRYRVEPAMD